MLPFEGLLKSLIEYNRVNIWKKNLFNSAIEAYDKSMHRTLKKSSGKPDNTHYDDCAQRIFAMCQEVTKRNNSFGTGTRTSPWLKVLCRMVGGDGQAEELAIAPYQAPKRTTLITPRPNTILTRSLIRVPSDPPSPEPSLGLSQVSDKSNTEDETSEDCVMRFTFKCWRVKLGIVWGGIICIHTHLCT